MGFPKLVIEGGNRKCEELHVNVKKKKKKKKIEHAIWQKRSVHPSNNWACHRKNRKKEKCSSNKWTCHMTKLKSIKRQIHPTTDKVKSRGAIWQKRSQKHTIELVSKLTKDVSKIQQLTKSQKRNQKHQGASSPNN